MDFRGAFLRRDGIVGSHRKKAEEKTYVNCAVKEKNHFRANGGVEVFVEVVETLQIHAYPENGMKDARCIRQISAVLAR